MGEKRKDRFVFRERFLTAQYYSSPSLSLSLSLSWEYLQGNFLLPLNLEVLKQFGTDS
jgi:hypothetical protein